MFVARGSEYKTIDNFIWLVSHRAFAAYIKLKAYQTAHLHCEDIMQVLSGPVLFLLLNRMSRQGCLQSFEIHQTIDDGI